MYFEATKTVVFEAVLVARDLVLQGLFTSMHPRSHDGKANLFFLVLYGFKESPFLCSCRGFSPVCDPLGSATSRPLSGPVTW
jgi:hypothetical protein